LTAIDAVLLVMGQTPHRLAALHRLLRTSCRGAVECVYHERNRKHHRRDWS